LGELLFLSESDVRRLLDLDELVDALQAGFLALSAGRTSVPPRIAATTPDGLLAAMPGFVPDAGLMAKLVSVFAANPERGLPSHQAVIVLFDEAMGVPLAVMDGTHITAVRTAASAALAARVLARPASRVLAILGAGVQARAHLDLFPRVRDFEEVRIASRTADRARALAAERPGATAVAAFEDAVRGADVVCCCTDAPEPVIDGEWLRPGTHVSSVGVGFELDTATLARGRVFVEWRGAALHPFPAGARELAGTDPETVTELGEVLSGARPGRLADAEITVYKSTGHAVEDAVAARLVHDRARRPEVGRAASL